MEKAFSAYRLQYRDAAWTDAVGESIGVLRVRGGRDLRNATITRVTEVGLEIRHDEGLARVQAPDLPAELRARFQWDEVNRAKALADEIRQHEAVAKVGEAAPAPQAVAVTGRRVETNSPDPGEVLRLRNAVELWQTRVRNLRAEHATALYNTTRDSKSVPGTLETWSARGNRLGSDLAKARAALAVARGKLAEAAPTDPLLRQDPKDE